MEQLNVAAASDHGDSDSGSEQYDLGDSDDSAAFDLSDDGARRSLFSDKFNERAVMRNKDILVPAGTRVKKKNTPDLRAWQDNAALLQAFARDKGTGISRVCHSSTRLAEVSVSVGLQEITRRAFQKQVLAPIKKSTSTHPWPFMIILRKLDEVQQRLVVDSAFSQTVLQWHRKKIEALDVFSKDELDWLIEQLAHSSVSKLNILGQKCWVRWGEHPAQQHAFPCRPCAMESKSATCIRAAVDSAVKGVAFSELWDLAARVHVLVVLWCTDSAASMRLCWREATASSPKNVIAMASVCDLHQLNLAQQAQLQALDHINFFYASCKLLRQQAYFIRFLVTMINMFLRGFEWLPDSQPPPEWRAFSRIVFKYTVQRRSELRSAASSCSPQPAKSSRRRPARESDESAFSLYWDGNLLSAGSSHHCTACSPKCRSNAEAAAKILPF